MSITTTQTFSDLQRDGWTVCANCNGRHCGRGRPLDLAQLIARFGPDHVFINDTKIASRLVCRSCGHRGGRLIFTTPGNADGGAG